MVNPQVMLELAKADHERALREANFRRTFRSEAKPRTPTGRKFAMALIITTLVASTLSVMASANGGLEGILMDASAAGAARSSEVR